MFAFLRACQHKQIQAGRRLSPESASDLSEAAGEIGESLESDQAWLVGFSIEVTWTDGLGRRMPAGDCCAAVVEVYRSDEVAGN